MNKPRESIEKTTTSPTETEVVPLIENDALRMALVHERAEHAATVAKARDAERLAELARIQTKYAEGGKYVVMEINIRDGSVRRTKVGSSPSAIEPPAIT